MGVEVFQLKLQLIEGVDIRGQTNDVFERHDGYTLGNTASSIFIQLNTI